MKRKCFLLVLFLVIAVFLSGCSGIILPNNVFPEAERFVGEWKSISPTRLSKVEIYIFGNNIYIHVWENGNKNHPENYDWGVQNLKISDSFNNDVIKLYWEYYSNQSCDQEMEVLNNGVLKVKSTINFYDDAVYTENNSYSYTDYFYNSEASNSFIPDIPEMGLYQDDPEFVNLVYQLDSPKKICQYIEKNGNYKILFGPHSPYQTYLSKEGDCGDAAIFASSIAHFHGYKSNMVRIEWTNSEAHYIVVYDIGDHYTYSCNHLYFSQSFNSVLECVNHCTSRFGFILSYYELHDWNYYNYRNIMVR